jgi:phosphoribosyl 1,2-cyclic phosphate phosphodiesterase
MTLTFTILGCGSSMGVPRVALGWGDCDPNNPKNRRRRCSLLVERGSGDAVTRVLVDTSPDLREQLLDAQVTSLNAVFYTHGHADHTHGIDDLRPLFIKARQRVNVYLDEPTGGLLEKKFGYCFETPAGSGYPPILQAHRVAAGQRIDVEGPGGVISVLPVLQRHGEITSLGYRFDGLAYSCDINGLPDESIEVMSGLQVWIVDALRDAPHPSHFTLADALAWIERLKPKRAILTNLNPEFDYEALRARLPSHVEPAYDGLRVALPLTA